MLQDRLSRSGTSKVVWAAVPEASPAGPHNSVQVLNKPYTCADAE